MERFMKRRAPMRLDEKFRIDRRDAMKAILTKKALHLRMDFIARQIVDVHPEDPHTSSITPKRELLHRKILPIRTGRDALEKHDRGHRLGKSRLHRKRRL